MKKVIIGMLLLLFAVSGCKKDSRVMALEKEVIAQKKTSESLPRPAEAEKKSAGSLPSLGPAPDFSLLDTRHDEITLSDYKDKHPVLLFFWTTWCPFCQKEIRILNDQYGGLIKDGFEVFAVNVGERSSTVENFASSYYLSFRVLLDREGVVAAKYAILGVPTYVLIDKHGSIIFKDNYFPQQEYKKIASP